MRTVAAAVAFACLLAGGCSAVNVPALWLLGTGDRSIPVETTLTNLKMLEAGGKPFEWRTYEGLDHGLGPQIWDDVGPWIQRFLR